MRKAFTLMEVLVATILISIVGLALLQSGANNTKIIGVALNKESSNEIFSLVLLNSKEEWHNSNKNILDFAKNKFDISNDSIRTKLKNHELAYTQEESTIISLLDLSEELKDELRNQGMIETLEGLPKIAIEKILMSSEHGNSYGYVLKTQK